jgi:CRISPR-associated endonuclease/helicase Cas3
VLGLYQEHLRALGWEKPQPKQSVASHPLLESTLALRAVEFNLLLYLVASHHGKVRLGLHASPLDQMYAKEDGRGWPIRGVREGDRLPEVALGHSPTNLAEVQLTLEPASLGLSRLTGPSWVERCCRLLGEYSPAALASIEAIFRSADVRASKMDTPDPWLEEKER